MTALSVLIRYRICYESPIVFPPQKILDIHGFQRYSRSATPDRTHGQPAWIDPGGERCAGWGALVLKVSGASEPLKRRIAIFLMKEARSDLEKLVAVHAAAGTSIRSISIKDTRSRWGSCSQDGNLSFSWRIVMAPEKIIDYLVAHLREMNHGPRFWALCEKLCPHTQEAKFWLKRHGLKLHAIDFD